MSLCDRDLFTRHSSIKSFFQVFPQRLSVPDEGSEDGDHSFVDEDSAGGKSREFGLDVGQELARRRGEIRRQTLLFLGVILGREFEIRTFEHRKRRPLTSISRQLGSKTAYSARVCSQPVFMIATEAARF